MFDMLSGLFGGPAVGAGSGGPINMFGAAGPNHPVPTFGSPEAAAPGVGGEGSSLGSLLRGVQAPKAPETQRLSGPSMAPAPRAPTPVKSGDLLQFLQLMNAGGGATAKTNYELPSTLGMALRGRY